MDEVFEQNISELLQISKDNGRSKTYLYYEKKCYSLLEGYLERQAINYSAKIGLEWLHSLPSTCNTHGFLEAINRLNAYYENKKARIITFERTHCFYKDLSPYWQEKVDEYLAHCTDDCKLKKSNLNRHKESASFFLYFLQEKSIEQVSQISFQSLKDFCDNSLHRNHRDYTTHLGIAYALLTFLADKYNCRRSLGLYLHYVLFDEELKYTDEDEAKFREIYQRNCQMITQSQLDDDLPECINRFIETLKKYKYSLTVIRTTKLSFGQMLVFLDSHQFHYCPELIKAWFDTSLGKTFKNRPMYRQSRRQFAIFEQYIKSGDIPTSKQIYKPLLFDSLPDWCRRKITSYTELIKREGKGFSALSLARDSLVRFCQFLVSKHISSFSDVTAETLKQFNIEDTHETSVGKNTYNVRIRDFIKYLEREGTIKNCFLHEALLHAKTNGEHIVVVLTNEEKEELKQTEKNVKSSLELRDKAIILLGLKMGLRGIDIVNLKLDEIDWKNSIIQLVQRKTCFEVRLPMPVEVGNALYEYITQGRPKVKSDLVFLKSVAPYSGIRPNAAYKALKRALPDRNVPKSGFHVTRKTFATEQLKKGVPAATIADMLGQHGTSQLNRYLSLDEENMKQCPLSLKECGIMLEVG